MGFEEGACWWASCWEDFAEESFGVCACSVLEGEGEGRFGWVRIDSEGCTVVRAREMIPYSADIGFVSPFALLAYVSLPAHSLNL